MAEPGDGTMHLSSFGGYTVTFERDLNFKMEDVWRAITDPARLVDWYAEVNIDKRVGGMVEQKFANSGATTYSMITEYDEPRVFAHMWVTGKVEAPTQPVPESLRAGNGTCGDATLAGSVIRFELSGNQPTHVKLTHYVPLNPELIPNALKREVAAAPHVTKTPAPDMVLATWDIGLELLERALAQPGIRAMSLRGEQGQAAWPWAEFKERRRMYASLGRDAVLNTFRGSAFTFI